MGWSRQHVVRSPEHCGQPLVASWTSRAPSQEKGSIPLRGWQTLQGWECVTAGREAWKPLRQSAEWHEKLPSGNKIRALFQSLPTARGPGNVWVYAQHIHGLFPSSAPVWLDNEYVWWGKEEVWGGCLFVGLFWWYFFLFVLFGGKVYLFNFFLKQVLFLGGENLAAVFPWSASFALCTLLKYNAKDEKMYLPKRFLELFFMPHNSFQLYHVAVKWSCLF